MDTAEIAAWYRRFADDEAAGSSPSYERLARSIADDADLLGWLDQLPARKRQPNLLFASVRFLGGPTDIDGFFGFVRSNERELADLMSRRSTQTNEAARCAAFVPVLAEIGAPLALIEVGASAGLCLYPDRYSYRFDGELLGESPLAIRVDTAGTLPAPERLPSVVWRRGLDLHPLDVNDDSDLAWLRACIWPEHDERRQRLDLAASIVAHDPPRIESGDLRDATVALIDDAPPDAFKVVFHSAVLAYVDEPSRRQFAEAMLGTVDVRDDVLWLSNEGRSIVAGIDSTTQTVAPPASGAPFHLGRNGTELLALTDPHGRWLRWTSRP